MYASARDISKLYRWSVGYVYRQAHLHRWRRIVLDGRVRYSREDVDQTFWAGRLREVKTG